MEPGVRVGVVPARSSWCEQFHADRDLVVGDDEHSYSFDITRCNFFNNGEVVRVKAGDTNEGHKGRGRRDSGGLSRGSESEKNPLASLIGKAPTALVSASNIPASLAGVRDAFKIHRTVTLGLSVNLEGEAMTIYPRLPVGNDTNAGPVTVTSGYSVPIGTGTSPSVRSSFRDGFMFAISLTENVTVDVNIGQEPLRLPSKDSVRCGDVHHLSRLHLRQRQLHGYPYGFSGRIA